MTTALAPMAGLSHRALRELILGFGGCDYFFSEMISAPALLNNGHLEKYYTDAGPHPDRVVYQLVGADAEMLAAGAALLDERSCAGIDLNMGCSAPKITRDGGGVRWMSNPDAAVRMVARVRERVKKHPLSVKMRLGGDDDPDRLRDFARRLQSAGIDQLTLHPRTAKQHFKRTARWSFVEDLASELKIPVVGNGDIASPQGLVQRLQGPWSGIMVGRGAVTRPWLFAAAQQSDPTPHPPLQSVDREAVGLRFITLLRRHQPPEFWKSRMFRFFDYYCSNFAWGHNLAVALRRENDLASMEQVWRGYFHSHPHEKILKLD